MATAPKRTRESLSQRSQRSASKRKSYVDITGSWSDEEDVIPVPTPRKDSKRKRVSYTGQADAIS
jgi:hypothetical protein